MYASTDLLVSVHGCALTGLVYMRQKSHVVEIWGDDRSNVNKHYYIMAGVCCRKSQRF